MALSEKHIIGMNKKNIDIVTILNFMFKNNGPKVNSNAHTLIIVLYPKYLENLVASKTIREAGMITATMRMELVLLLT